MRATINVIAMTVAIVLSTGRLQLALAGDAAAQNLAPLKQLAQGGDSGGYLPACPNGSFYACYFGVYGGRNCGCWPGRGHPVCPQGYHYECRLNRYDPNAKRYCACW